MSTIQCQGCGKRIIQKGEKCPHCGEPIPQDNASLKTTNASMHVHKHLEEKSEKEVVSDDNGSMLIECKACGKSISKNAMSCPHCGEPLSHKTDNPLSSKDNKESILGFGGATLLMIGAFLPAINIPIRGSVSYINNGRGDGMLIILIALLAFYYVYKKRKRSLMLSGGLSLIIIAYGFVNVLQKVAEIQKGATSGLGQALLGGVGVGPAFGVTAVGAILIIISSFMMKNKS